jgi:prevent-host-death family protein
MATVKMAYAKANLPKLLARVARGERIVISRYNTPMAELVPPADVQRPLRKFGTGKGRAAIIDPRAFDAMTNEEADSFLKGIY